MKAKEEFSKTRAAKPNKSSKKCNPSTSIVQLKWCHRVPLDVACNDIRALLVALEVLSRGPNWTVDEIEDWFAAHVTFEDKCKPQLCEMWPAFPDQMIISDKTLKMLWQSLGGCTAVVVKRLAPSRAYMRMRTTPTYSDDFVYVRAGECHDMRPEPLW